jgi:hypothetical protein
MKLTLLFFIVPFTLLAQSSRWSFELHGGGVYNARLPLIIKQEGYPDIRIEKAVFHSEPFVSPFYWDWRFTKWFKNKSIEFEAIHHKLYLINKPIEVQRFGISHGFNMMMFNHGRQIKSFIGRVGLGSVLLHPESTIRDKKYVEGPGMDIHGYKLRGIVLNIALAKQIKFGKHFFINTEGKITAATAKSPIVDGYARVYNVAFQLILGPGFNWCVKE